MTEHNNAKNDCLFCKMVAGDIPVTKVYEDEHTLAFLDINPVADGHTLVIPKAHAEEFFELDSENYTALGKTVKKVAEAIKETYNPPRVGVLVYGFHVAHTHIHLYPNTGQEITMHHIQDYPKEKLQTEAKKLKEYL